MVFGVGENLLTFIKCVGREWFTFNWAVLFWVVLAILFYLSLFRVVWSLVGEKFCDLPKLV